MNSKNVLATVLILALLYSSALTSAENEKRTSANYQDICRNHFKSEKNKQFQTIFLSVLGLIFAGWIYYYVRDTNLKKSKIFLAYENSKSPNSSLSDFQINEAIQKFKDKTWKVQFSFKTSAKDPKQWTFKVTEIKMRTQFVYDFYGTGTRKGYLGFPLKDIITGILIFTKAGISICFVYGYYCLTSQPDHGRSWQYLICEAEEIESPLEFGGKWYYNGHQDCNSLSGTMKIVQN